ncbi:MAG: DNA-binding transcriptional regulator [Cyclobacteriaceae bacterium]
MRLKKKVFVHLESSRGYGRELLKGIYEYNNRVNNWEIIFEPAYYLQSGIIKNNIRIIKAMKPNGCIIENQENIGELVKMGIPVVQTTSINRSCSVPCIKGNYEEDGKMAFMHFMNLGFRNLGFFGVDFINFSKFRYESFKHQADQHHVPVFAHRLAANNKHYRYQNNFKRTIDWLRSLPKPIGILACNDDFGQTLINACSLAGVKVPYEVAVLGVDNDELLCNLTVPNLSSIARNLTQASSEICKLLDQMMNGINVTRDFIQTNPTEIIVRQSTDTIACDDLEVVKAIIFIRENTHRQVTVDDVVKATTISRRSLYGRFEAVTGHSINSEIQQRKLHKFKKLLKEKKLSIKEIAYEVGFDDVAHVSRWFSSLESLSPTEWKLRNA